MRRRGLDPEVIPGDHTEESGIRAARTLLDGGRLDGPDAVTAVLASNDRTAAGFLDTVFRSGVAVPQQMSVVGYDDSRLARLAYINLTTVAQDVPELARRAVSTVVGRLAEPGEPADIRLEPRLVIRGTTAPRPAEPGQR